MGAVVTPIVVLSAEERRRRKEREREVEELLSTVPLGAADDPKDC